MSDPLKKVQPGDPLRIPAETFNTFVDAAADLRARRHDVQARNVPTPRNATIILVKPNVQRGRFEPLGLGEPVIGPNDAMATLVGQPCFHAERGRPEVHGYNFCITQEPIAAGRIGRAAIAGPTWCYFREKPPFGLPNAVRAAVRLSEDWGDRLYTNPVGLELLWRDPVPANPHKILGLIDLGRRVQAPVHFTGVPSIGKIGRAHV